MRLIKYNTDEERIQAAHERNKIHSDIGNRIGDIAKIHSKISEYKPMTTYLTNKEIQLTLVVLQMVVSDILHEDAEMRFLQEQLNK
jgi:hypothetical protein